MNIKDLKETFSNQFVTIVSELNGRKMIAYIEDFYCQDLKAYTEYRAVCRYGMNYSGDFVLNATLFFHEDDIVRLSTKEEINSVRNKAKIYSPFIYDLINEDEYKVECKKVEKLKSAIQKRINDFDSDKLNKVLEYINFEL